MDNLAQLDQRVDQEIVDLREVKEKKDQ